MKELEAEVESLRKSGESLVTKQLPLIRERFENLQSALAPILGEQIWSEPLEVHSARTALGAVQDVLYPTREAR